MRTSGTLDARKWETDYEIPQPSVMPFYVGERWHEERRLDSAHMHHGVEFGAITSGVMHLYVGGDMHTLHAGDCYFLNGMTPHGGIRPADSRCHIIYCRLSTQALLWIPPPENGYSLLGLFLSGEGGPILKGLRQALPLFQAAARFYVPGDLSALSRSWASVVQVLDLLRTAAHDRDRGSQRTDTRLRDPAVAHAIQYIYSRFNEDFSLTQLAAHCGVSLSLLCHRFKQALGCSPIHYRNLIRIDHAMRRIVTTDDPIETIAFDCGFSSLSFFRDLFKRCNGHPPAFYRSAK
jgi:AraC-like DNA-binding protein